MKTYTAKDLEVSCKDWDRFGGETYAENHRLEIADDGTMTLRNADGSEFNEVEEAKEFAHAFGRETTLDECEKFVSDYHDAWLDAGHLEFKDARANDAANA